MPLMDTAFNGHGKPGNGLRHALLPPLPQASSRRIEAA